MAASTSRLLNTLILTLLFVAGATTLYWIYLDPISTIQSDSIEDVTVQRAHDNEHAVLLLRRRVCSSRSGVPIMLSTDILGRVMHSIPPVEIFSSQGCQTFTRRREIPLLPDGSYVWQSRYRFCNPMRCIDYPLSSFTLEFSNGEPRVLPRSTAQQAPRTRSAN